MIFQVRRQPVRVILWLVAALGAGNLSQTALAEEEAILHAKALSRAFRKAAEATVPTVVKITTHSKPQVFARPRPPESLSRLALRGILLR